MDAGQLATGDFEIARHARTDGEQHGVEVGAQLIGRDVATDVDARLEDHAFFGHLLNAALDQGINLTEVRYGTQTTTITGGDDLGRQMAGTWEVLLPAIVRPDSLNYYREFLARQSMRASTPRR